MKKGIIFGLLTLSFLTFAEGEIPENVEKEISKSARGLDGSQRMNYVNWQKRSYLKLEEIGRESGIPKEEFDRIMDKLERMYGSNYAKQLQVVSDEINDYKEVVKRVEAATNTTLVDEKTNEEAKKQIEETLNMVKIPEDILGMYKSTAEELFPNNYPKQKEYLDICVRDYPKLLELIKKEIK